jgi:hypothetical protein
MYYTIDVNSPNWLYLAIGIVIVISILIHKTEKS